MLTFKCTLINYCYGRDTLRLKQLKKLLENIKKYTKNLNIDVKN